MSALLRTSLYYFPPVYVMEQAKAAGRWIFNKEEVYYKRTFRNSALILDAQGLQLLSVPLMKGKTYAAMHQVRISYDMAWPRQHLRAIQTAYGKCPFFPYYFDDIAVLLSTHYQYLWQLNQAIAEWLISLPAYRSIALMEDDNLHTTARELDVISRANYENFEVEPYYQPFSPATFRSNLSVIDRLMNVG